MLIDCPRPFFSESTAAAGCVNQLLLLLLLLLLPLLRRQLAHKVQQRRVAKEVLVPRLHHAQPLVPQQRDQGGHVHRLKGGSTAQPASSQPISPI